jgi:hypothetical protein
MATGRDHKAGLPDPVWVKNAVQGLTLPQGVMPIAITDLDGEVVNVTGNGLDVFIQDQTTELIDLRFIREDDTFTLAAPISVDDTTFTVTAGHSIIVGDVVELAEGKHLYQALALGVVGNVITIDCVFDRDFTIAASGVNGTGNMALDASGGTETFRVTPKNLVSTEWDIVRVIFAMTDDSSMDDGTFGGIAALTNGVVLRAHNSNDKNVFNVKTNGDFALRSFDAEYADRVPAGQFGFRSRRTFGGQDKNGIVIRLDSDVNDEIQLLLRDDLSGLLTFEAVAQGHTVEP